MSVSPKDDHIKVIIRSRPLNAEEKAARTPTLVRCDPDHKTVTVSTQIGGKRGKKTYNFDMAFGQYASQADIYKAAVSPIVHEVLQGYNCTVFAYGQTGTGKTYTMEGNIDCDETKGVIPRAAQSIFEQLQAKEDAEYSAKVSFLELYNEELQDLLSVTDEQKLRIVDDRTKLASGVSCHNLEEVMVKSPGDIIETMRKAMSKRQTAATKLNKNSSRSHCIFTLTVHIKETTPEGEDLLKVGKLNLVDLAGSESIGRSGAKDKRAREAGNINRSLLTLGRVISALVEKTPHIPYRDSKLTRLLQESLGGKAKTCIIATVAPSVQCMEETLSTLDYASRAKNIKNRPEANQKMTKRALIKEYADDIQRLREELASARAKDGVYLPEDTYNSMVADLESKRNQLEELEATLESRQKELDELTSLFETTSETLENTTQELDETKSKLSSTELELGGTKIKLMDEKQKVKDGRLIIDAHRKTERELHETSRKLQETIEDISGDVYMLHDKISHKENLEDKNIASSLDYHQITANSIEEVSRIGSDFYEKQKQFLEDCEQRLNNSHELVKLQKEDVSTIIRKNVAESETSVCGIEAKISEQSNSLESLILPAIEKHIIKNVSLSEDTMKSIQIGIEASFDEIIGKYLADAKVQRDLWASEIAELLESQKLALSHYNTTMKGALDDLKNTICQNTKLMEEKLQEEKSHVQRLLNSEKERIPDDVNGLITDIKSLVESFTEAKQQRFNKGLVESMDQTDKLIANINSDAETVRTNIQTTIEHTTRCVQENMKAFGQMETRNSKFETNVTDLIKKNTELLCDSRSAVKCKVDESHTKLNHQGDEFREYVQKFKCDTITSSEETLQLLKSLQEKTRENNRVVVDKVCLNWDAYSKLDEESRVLISGSMESNAQHNQDVQERLKSLETSCSEFVHNTLQKDTRSGNTPTKRSYEYPKEIPSTSPEQSILEKAHLKAKSAESSPLEARTLKPRSNSIDSPYFSQEEGENNALNANRTGNIENTSSGKREHSVPPPKRNLVFTGEDSTERILTNEEIQKMKVVELRKELSSRNCPQFGNKTHLQQRLIKYMQSLTQ